MALLMHLAALKSVNKTWIMAHVDAGTRVHLLGFNSACITPQGTTDLHKGETNPTVWGLEEDLFKESILALDDLHFNNVRPDVSF